MKPQRLTISCRALGWERIDLRLDVCRAGFLAMDVVGGSVDGEEAALSGRIEARGDLPNLLGYMVDLRFGDYAIRSLPGCGGILDATAVIVERDRHHHEHGEVRLNVTDLFFNVPLTALGF